MPRAGLTNGFYFDPDVFASYMQEEKVFDDTIIQSGILQPSPVITSLIGTQGNVFTIPFYKPLTGTAANNDGENDITSHTLSGGKQTGMSFRRWASWTDKDFTRELSGTNPLGDCVTKIAGFWREQNQNNLLGILGAVCDNASLSNHTTNIAVTTDTAPQAANKISTEATLDAMQKALGSRQRGLRTVMMHSVIYNQLVKANLINNVQTVMDNNTQSPFFGTFLGMNVIISDDITVKDNATSKRKEYHTFIVGEGAFLTAPARVDVPIEFDRDAKIKGGTNSVITRTGMVIHPNGFDFNVTAVASESPTDAELATTGNYTLKINEKLIPLVRIITNA